MKKTIFAIVMAAIVSLFSVSCNKTSMNTNKLIGTWQLMSGSETYNNITETENLTQYNITLQFNKGGILVITGVEGTRSISYTGNWSVVDDSLLLSTTSNDARFNATYVIESLDNKSLIASTTRAYSSTIYTIRYTFSKL